jgi:hypothetical protein
MGTSRSWELPVHGNINISTAINIPIAFSWSGNLDYSTRSCINDSDEVVIWQEHIPKIAWWDNRGATLNRVGFGAVKFSAGMDTLANNSLKSLTDERELTMNGKVKIKSVAEDASHSDILQEVISGAWTQRRRLKPSIGRWEPAPGASWEHFDYSSYSPVNPHHYIQELTISQQKNHHQTCHSSRKDS